MSMTAKNLQPLRMDELVQDPVRNQLEWIWHGYLARRHITLLTSQWKSGKTTLIAGLLRQLETGGEFIGRPCRQASALVISEEPSTIWMERLRSIPIGSHVQLLARPFPRRPDPDEWNDLIAQIAERKPGEQPDLVIVDTLASFLPGRSDCDPATLLDFLHPLRWLAESGVAVLVQHHPRKESSELGSAARGSGALLGFVDFILELHRHSNLSTDAIRRSLHGVSRYLETPARLVYEWLPGTPNFQAVIDPPASRFEENWPTLEAILKNRKSEATNRELLADWPEDQPQPTAAMLYHWLQYATTRKQIIRVGLGTKTDPYRYRVPNEHDRWVASLPPLPDLPPLEPPGGW